jgi:nucleotide-binding universal stress UspA family protein
MSDSTAPVWRIRHIVAGTDFSEASAQALERAAALARECAARLTLAHVVPASLWDDIGAQLASALGIGAESVDTALAQARERTQERAAELAAAHSVACEARVCAGRPAATLGQIAAEAGADLLVVGAHGAHPVRALVVGTTAQKLLRVAPCPVLVVKRPPPFDYRTVLVPTDFSAPARAALIATAALLPQAHLHVAHAFELPYDGLMRYAAVDAAAVAHYHAAARERLTQDLADWTAAAGIAPARRTLHVEHGYPPTQVEGWIASTRADLVVIAAHGKSELEATLLGSVSLHTVLAATCDVLLLRGAAQA